jgi:hypothetical protein
MTSGLNSGDFVGAGDGFAPEFELFFESAAGCDRGCGKCSGGASAGCASGRDIGVIGIGAGPCEPWAWAISGKLTTKTATAKTIALRDGTTR